MLLRSPVLTKYGNTYEFAAIHYHVTMFRVDPLNNQPLAENELVPNLNLSHAIEVFLDDNPWAFEYKTDDCIESIKFD